MKFQIKTNINRNKNNICVHNYSLNILKKIAWNARSNNLNHKYNYLIVKSIATSITVKYCRVKLDSYETIRYFQEPIDSKDIIAM